MGEVLVRNLDDHVIELLKHKAEIKGHSLEQELRACHYGGGAVDR